jgi:hypothetical protein
MQLVHFKLNHMIVCVLKQSLCYLHLKMPFGDHLVASCAFRQVFIVFLLQEFCFRCQEIYDFDDCFTRSLLEVIIARWTSPYELRYSYIGMLLVFLMVGSLDNHGQVAVLVFITR